MSTYDDKSPYILGDIEELRRNASKLSSVREDIHSLNLKKWNESLTSAQNELDVDTILLFIGEFSSGKSTFINVLLGEQVLPTANSPCTRLITEIQFVSDGRGNRGKIFYKVANSEPKECSFAEVTEFINSQTGQIGVISGIHHVNLIYDIPESKIEQSIIGQLKDKNIKLVDTPGFGSPYPFDEEFVIEHYVSRAAHSFWFFAADKIGGIPAFNTISKLLNHTREIIPVIAKSDLINEREKAEIKKVFIEKYGSIFQKREPVFISSYKINELNKIENQIEKMSTDNPELQYLENKKETLMIESGMEYLATEIIKQLEPAKQKKVYENRYKAILKKLKETAESIKRSAEKEIEYWDRKLNEAGWMPNEQDKKIKDKRKRLEDYCKDECIKISQTFENELTRRVTSILKAKKGVHQIGKAISNEINNIKREIIEPELTKVINEIIQDIGVNREFNTDIPIDGPALESFKEQLLRNVSCVFESITRVGPQAVFSGGAGMFLLAALPAIKGWSFIGGPLAAVCGPVGCILLAFALVPFIPELITLHKEKRENAEKEVRNKIKDWLEIANIKNEIQKKLNEIIDDLYTKATDKFENEIKDLKRNKEAAEEVQKKVEDILKNMDIRFGN